MFCAVEAGEFVEVLRFAAVGEGVEGEERGGVGGRGGGEGAELVLAEQERAEGRHFGRCGDGEVVVVVVVLVVLVRSEGRDGGDGGREGDTRRAYRSGRGVDFVGSA